MRIPFGVWLLVAIFVVPAIAQNKSDWVRVTTSPVKEGDANVFVWAIQPSKIVRTNTLIEFWIRKTYLATGIGDESRDLMQFRADCTKRRMALVGAAAYDRDGKLEWREMHDDVQLEVVIPETIEEKIFTKACELTSAPLTPSTRQKVKN